MIVCPNCNHPNPEGATQCEACYTPLPQTSSCPNCGAQVQADATFCGQCGFNLVPEEEQTMAIPETEVSSPSTGGSTPIPTAVSEMEGETSAPPQPSVELEKETPIPTPPPTVTPTPPPTPVPTPSGSAATQLQIQKASLLHLQTNTTIELPPDLTVIHIGKPNDQIPPDVDVSGFPNSDIVSRVHADIRVEGDIYYLEDVGSSNGTYVNHTPLPPGNRHRLRPGDRISLGKGDKVTFLFQQS
ncbi:MAG: FHA domain-containing protein [Cyanobacteriota bacterium]